MTRFKVASFNVKNLIGADREYYRFQSYTPEEYAFKRDWLANQLLSMNADVVGLQEIFEEDALRDVVSTVDAESARNTAAHIPGADKRYHRRAIFDKLEVTPYGPDAIAFARNLNDGPDGARRPGVAILSRLGFVGDPEIIQQMETPLRIPLLSPGEDGQDTYTLHRLSRPILKVRIPVGDEVISVFTCHMKSKLGEYITPPGAEFAPEADLTQYDPLGRALGSLRAALRRTAEAWVLRGAILRELALDRPVIVTGDFNDGEAAVSSEMISGEIPFGQYEWMLRHDAKSSRDRYSAAEHLQITQDIEAVKLHSAEKMFVARSLRDMVYTSAFAGVYESIDQIYLSRHFTGQADALGGMDYFSVFNDHLTDGSHPEGPYNKLVSDHGQIMAHLRLHQQGEDR
jgi:hypothetical protein